MPNVGVVSQECSGVGVVESNFMLGCVNLISFGFTISKQVDVDHPPYAIALRTSLQRRLYRTYSDRL